MSLSNDVRFSVGFFDAISFECLKHHWPKEHPPEKHNRQKVEKKIAMFEMFLRGKTYKEIGKHFGTSPSRVGVHLHTVLRHVWHRQATCKCPYHKWRRACDLIILTRHYMDKTYVPLV